jgi:pantetheine-phosphate adenylyltransferase
VAWVHCGPESFADGLPILTGDRVSAPDHLIAVYPGTFDPMTLGHADLMRRGSTLFGKLIIAVATGHHKKTMFTVDERLAMATELAAAYPNVEVIAFSGLLSDFVGKHGGKVVVRGLRAVSDFEYEFQMAGMNRHLMPDVETVFLTPSDQYQFVSGTFVREIAMLGGDVSKFVAPSVLARLQARVAQTAAAAG